MEEKKCCHSEDNAGTNSSIPSSYSSNGESVTSSSYNHKRVRESVSRLIAAAGLPLDFGESPHFVKFIRESLFCPQYQKVTKETTRTELIKSYNARLVSVKDDIIRTNFGISLSSDVWKVSDKECYLSVAAHYIGENNLDMEKRVIGFKLVDASRIDESIAQLVLRIVGDFNLTNRVVSITFDNAIADTRAVRLLETKLDGILMHQCCVCDIVNATAKSGIEVLKPCLDIIRDAISFLNVHCSDLGDYKKYCKADGLRPKKFKLDSPARWDTTYLMLKSVVPYRNALTLFVNLKYGSVLLEESHWKIAEKFLPFLAKLYKATVTLSVVYTPSPPDVFHYMLDLACFLDDNKSDPLLSPCVSKMVEGFKKYWTEIPHLYSFAVILDPRIKFVGLCILVEHFGEILGFDYTQVLANARAKFEEVYRLYENEHKSRPPPPEPKRRKTITDLFLERSMARIKSHMKQSEGEQQHFSELDNYLNANPSFRNFEDTFKLLSWWRECESWNPVLSKLACDVLTVPVSTMCSESAFDTRGRVLEGENALVTSEMVEILTCLKDWENAAARTQYTTQNEELVATFENLFI